MHVWQDNFMVVKISSKRAVVQSIDFRLSIQHVFPHKSICVFDTTLNGTTNVLLLTVGTILDYGQISHLYTDVATENRHTYRPVTVRSC
ncbi:hypothetical protein TNCV_1695951 [Trichonephila clavipes]|nr:hypothetical protein TNCV_1695951 [Trichonephila clavipes]